MRTVFGTVTLVNVGHNFILIGAEQPPDLAALTARLREREIASVPVTGRDTGSLHRRRTRADRRLRAGGSAAAVGRDLREREGAQVGAVAMGDVPLDDAVQRRVEIPCRRPAQPLAGLGRVEREKARLVRMRA